MTRDATLDAFATSEDDDCDDEDGNGGIDEGTDENGDDRADEGEDEGADESEGDAGSETGPGPVVTTTDWAPGGAPCEACGATVERRWHQDGSLVCPTCKDWQHG